MEYLALERILPPLNLVAVAMLVLLIIFVPICFAGYAAAQGYREENQQLRKELEEVYKDNEVLKSEIEGLNKTIEAREQLAKEDCYPFNEVKE